MAELTEQQEQEMIERAKAGDPEANYQMSLWALAQGEAEPEEERWNRLAAKCLVKAAEAGYGPAREKMDELLAQTASAAEQAAPAPAEPEPAVPAYEPAEKPAAAPVSAPAQEKSSPLTALAGVGAKLKGLFAKKQTASDGEAEVGSAAGQKKGLLNFSEWDSAKWKKMQIICIVICIVLILLIVIMLATRGSRKNKEAEEVVPTPVQETIATPAPVVNTPEPSVYPDEATRAEIAAASLEVFPEESDYVTEAKSVTVSTNGSVLNMRRGPGQSYGQVSSMPNGSSVNVYAYRNGWALVKYGGAWGWCSNDYLT